MSSDLVGRLRSLRGALAGFDPAVFTGDDCRVLAEDLTTELPQTPANTRRHVAAR